MAFDSAAPISRRTVAKGIAWTAPAVAIAGTAPAFAVSGPCVPTIVINEEASCKIANESSYKLSFSIAGDTCDLDSCTGTITEIYEATGQGRTIWDDGPISADGGTAYICNTAYNMSNYVMVKGSITCNGQTTIIDDRVDMPQFTSANNTCADDFCAA